MSTTENLNTATLRADAVKAARGLRPFDMLVRNTVVLDMVTHCEREADIGMVGPLIASVHAADSARDAKAQLDADGAFAVPGLIDTHMHVESSMVTPTEYAKAVVPRGVTTALWDPHELANVAGMQGVDYACQATHGLPLRLLPLAPTCVPSAPGFEVSGGDFGPEQIARLLARDDIHGSAELMTMKSLLDGDQRVQGIVGAGLHSGKRVCGHGRGLTGGDLAAYATAGVESDHELTSAADLIARLEAGLTIELRGSHEHLLPEFAQAIISLGHMPPTITLCTDDIFPDDLLNKGALDHVIRVLINNDVPAAWVYRAATFHAANRIGRPDLGLIAPGKRADLVLITELNKVCANHVFTNGQLVAENGSLVNPAPGIAIPSSITQSVKLTAIKVTDFEIPATGPFARIATLSKPRFPEWGERQIAVQNGKLVLPNDMIRMAVCNRHGQNTPTRIALLENWGFWQGAFATTVSHDSHNLTVFGKDPEDMAAAANAIRLEQGGLAVASDGKIIASLALPLCGLMSENALENVAEEFANVRIALDQLVDWQPPYLVFKALFGASLVCNAGPRLSDVGLVDVFENRILESCVIEDALISPSPALS